ncbi:MAG: hypothetical protein MK105_18710 [Crocinitomicaceae bacterium]|nr:hypothetical protein [Crocinitomicaceae bacterium]
MKYILVQLILFIGAPHLVRGQSQDSTAVVEDSSMVDTFDILLCTTKYFGRSVSLESSLNSRGNIGLSYQREWILGAEKFGMRHSIQIGLGFGFDESSLWDQKFHDFNRNLYLQGSVSYGYFYRDFKLMLGGDLKYLRYNYPIVPENSTIPVQFLRFQGITGNPFLKLQYYIGKECHNKRFLASIHYSPLILYSLEADKSQRVLHGGGISFGVCF